MFVEMSFDIVFDRPIVKGVHYISPGGYELMFPNGDTVNFDFTYYKGTIDDDYNKIIHCYCYDLDEDVFEHDSDKHKLEWGIENYNLNKCKFSEFYVYTGEDDEPEINPVKVVNIEISLSRGGDIYKLPDHYFTEEGCNYEIYCRP